MSARGLATRALLSAALALPAVAAAGEPAAGEPPAQPAVDADAEEELLRALRRAERESFEHHDVERYFSVFAPDAVWRDGRREVADEHDLEVDRATRRAQLERRYRAGTTGREQVFFRDVEVERDAGRVVVSMTQRRVHFAGRDTARLRYVLAKADDGAWKVTEVRRWPLRDFVQGIVTVYDDAWWLKADEEADAVLANETVDPMGKVASLVTARRLKQALEVARAATEARPQEADLWRVRADLALSVGRLDESRSAVARARKLSPTVELPLHLQEDARAR